MQTGQILHQFTAREGQEVILCTLKWEDLDDLEKLINSLLDEGADILWSKPVTRDAVIDEQSRRLAARAITSQRIYLYDGLEVPY
jgi:hypothetical protein